MNAHLYPLLLLFAGVAVHIAKKAGQMYQADKSFKLWEYLSGHPYQTFLTFASAGGLYLGLVTADAVTLSSAFLAGVAANSLGDVAKGSR